METILNFRYRETSGELLNSFRVEPGMQVPAVDEFVTLEIDDEERAFKVVACWYAFAGFEGKLSQQIITVVVTD